MLNVCFDTGVLFHPRKLRQLALRPDVRLYGSTVNVFETVSDVNDERSFKKARSQMSLLLEVSGTRFLPDTDTLFKMYLGYPGIIADPYQWRKVAVWLAKANDLAEVDFIDFERARSLRRRHTDGWVSDVVNQMLRTMNPQIQTFPDWHSRATPMQVANVLSYLRSPAGMKQQIETWFRRERWWPMVVLPTMYEATERILEAYFLAHQGYLRLILEFNHKPEENDALDLDQVLPLWRRDWVFVSSDRRLLKCLELGGIDPRQYCAIQDLDPSAPLGVSPI